MAHGEQDAAEEKRRRTRTRRRRRRRVYSKLTQEDEEDEEEEEEGGGSPSCVTCARCTPLTSVTVECDCQHASAPENAAQIS